MFHLSVFLSPFEFRAFLFCALLCFLNSDFQSLSGSSEPVQYLLSLWLKQPERQSTERSEPSTPRALTTLATSFWPFSYLCRNSLSIPCRWSPSAEPALHSRRAGRGAGQSQSSASPRAPCAGSSFQNTAVNPAGDNGRCPG